MSRNFFVSSTQKKTFTHVKPDIFQIVVTSTIIFVWNLRNSLIVRLFIITEKSVYHLIVAISVELPRNTPEKFFEKFVAFPRKNGRKFSDGVVRNVFGTSSYTKNSALGPSLKETDTKFDFFVQNFERNNRKWQDTYQFYYARRNFWSRSYSRVNPQNFLYFLLPVLNLQIKRKICYQKCASI